MQFITHMSILNNKSLLHKVIHFPLLVKFPIPNHEERVPNLAKVKSLYSAHPHHSSDTMEIKQREATPPRRDHCQWKNLMFLTGQTITTTTTSPKKRLSSFFFFIMGRVVGFETLPFEDNL